MTSPENDNIANAIVADGNNFNFYGVTTGATEETGEPEAYLNGGDDHSLWYVFHPTVAGDIGFYFYGVIIGSGFELTGPGFSPTLTVYSSPGPADFSSLTKVTEG